MYRSVENLCIKKTREATNGVLRATRFPGPAVLPGDPTPSDQDPIAFGPSFSAALATPSQQMLQTWCNDLKIWLLDFPTLARLYSTHPSGSAATSLSPCKLWSSFCQDSGSGFRGVVSRDVPLRCVPVYALKTWPLDLLTLDRLYSTHLDSSAVNSLSPVKLWTFIGLVFAVGIGTWGFLDLDVSSMLSWLYYGTAHTLVAPLLS